MIWRDDDIGAGHYNRAGIAFPRTMLEDLRAVDDIFRRYGVTHTVAIVALGMRTRRDLVDLIRERGIVPQLHCWTHDDLTTCAEARDDLARGVDMLEELFGARPTVLYPPWNRTSQAVEEAAARLGMTVSARKISLSQWIRAGGDVAESVINFHYWHIPDVALLDPALRLRP